MAIVVTEIVAGRVVVPRSAGREHIIAAIVAAVHEIELGEAIASARVEVDADEVDENIVGLDWPNSVALIKPERHVIGAVGRERTRTGLWIIEVRR